MDHSQYNYTNPEALAEAVQKWTEATEAAVKAEGERLGIKHEQRSTSPRDSLQAVKGRVSYDRYGIPYKIGYRMSKNLVFVHKGVGKGTPIALAGQTNRRAKPWFNPIVEQRLPDLAESVAQNYATLFCKNVFIK